MTRREQHLIRVGEQRGLLQALVLTRDRTVFLLAFACGERAAEAGKLRLESLTLVAGTGQFVIDYELSFRGADLTEFGRGKKQSRRKRTKAYAIPDSEDRRLCVPQILATYLSMMWEYNELVSRGDGEPIYLFPRLNRQRSAFINKPVTTSMVAKKLRRYLTDMGEYAGETAHSLKRGGLLASPLSAAALARRTSLTIETVTLYRDIRRAHRGERGFRDCGILG